MDISLVFAGDRAMKVLNKKWRGKNIPANVLAFSLERSVGEIFINPQAAKREVNTYDVSYTARIAYLFIHGLSHLQGYNHETEKGAKEMEREERSIMQNVNIKV